MPKPENKTLEIKFNRLCLNDQPQTPFPFDNYLLYCSDSIHSDKLYLQPTFEFEKTEQPVPQLILIKKARGFSGITGTHNTENIHYEYKWQNDSRIEQLFYTQQTYNKGKSIENSNSCSGKLSDSFTPYSLVANLSLSPFHTS